MNRIYKYVRSNLKETVTVIIFGTVLIIGGQSILMDQVQATVEAQLEDSKTIDSIGDAVLFNTNQDYYDMRASVLKQGEKLENDPADMKEADIEYLTTQCGLMDSWNNKGYDVTDEREICELFNVIKLENVKK